MVGLLLTWAWAAEPCALGPELAAAEARVLELDFAPAHAALDRVEDGFACGASEPSEIARYWLLTGALASFEGDTERAEGAMIAARGADPTVWIEALGAQLRTRWEVAAPSAGDAALTLDPLPDGFEVRVNGAVQTGALRVRPGLHVVQARGGDQGWGRVFRAQADEEVTLPTTLKPIVAATPVPVDPSEDPAPAGGSPVALHLGLGFVGARGQELTPAEITEPATKFGPTLEAGVLLRPSRALWVRAAVGGDLLLAGRYVWVDDQGGEHGWPVAPAAHLAAGTRFGRADVGGLVGAQLPGRLTMRAVVSLGLTELLRAELRAGLNLGTPDEDEDGVSSDRPRLEPAGGLLVTLEI